MELDCSVFGIESVTSTVGIWTWDSIWTQNNTPIDRKICLEWMAIDFADPLPSDRMIGVWSCKTRHNGSEDCHQSDADHQRPQAELEEAAGRRLVGHAAIVAEAQGAA
jgi:hypothetical protein